MHSIARIFSVTCALLLNSPMVSVRVFAADSTPRVFIIDGAALTIAKRRTQPKDGSLKPALAKLIREADRALTIEPLSVTRKEIAPPSGDRHDYMSLAPY